MGQRSRIEGTLENERRAHRRTLSENWIVVERYCKDFASNDFRIVLKRGDTILEISVEKEVYDSLGDI